MELNDDERVSRKLDKLNTSISNVMNLLSIKLIMLSFTVWFIKTITTRYYLKYMLISKEFWIYFHESLLMYTNHIVTTMNLATISADFSSIAVY